ncbi:leucine-rich repeat-containing protein 59 [Toxorhynchites rutilus septentrionalis]|uniref:leucine-rich repeat-containing protein 59 n=1 Tax=Toxorhynchites rutilus septentrionalis TaxID=329112 RepID=UPI00247AFC0B|nr:leucine-rich repeat-containing protein 59 [Toxorhynchites rutilus septentrionalis]
MSKRSKNKVEQDKINVRERLTDNVLDLSLMNISIIPVADIKTLKRATILDLSNNIITSINVDFTQLVQLTKLDLSKNKIKLITDEFGNLANLRHLDLYNNQIERLPLSFGRLKKLRYLDLKNNPLNPGFSKIIGTCSDQKDCIEAARKAVSFMADIEKQVLEERRKERELKILEMNQLQEKIQEIAHNDKAHVDKKRKNKKSKVKNNETGSDKDNSNPKQKGVHETTDILNTSHVLKKEKCVAKMKIVLGLFFVVVLIIGIICAIEPNIKNYFNEPYSEILEEYIK